MTVPPDDRVFRREMATAYRSGWHFIDLVTAIPHRGDSLMVTLFGEPIVVAREEDEDVLWPMPRPRPRKVYILPSTRGFTINGLRLSITRRSAEVSKSTAKFAHRAIP